MPKRILITGSRDWTDFDTLNNALYAWWDANGRERDVVFVHGGCPTGADRIAADIAFTHHFSQEVHPADWDTHGRAAGPIRNRAMVDSAPDVCLGFVKNRSKGASGTVKLAGLAGIPTFMYEENDDEHQ